jgi:hypothetical protein
MIEVVVSSNIGMESGVYLLCSIEMFPEAFVRAATCAGSVASIVKMF